MRFSYRICAVHKQPPLLPSPSPLELADAYAVGEELPEAALHLVGGGGVHSAALVDEVGQEGFLSDPVSGMSLEDDDPLTDVELQESVVDNVLPAHVEGGGQLLERDRRDESDL